jgi:hypothetical protein
MTDYRSAVDNVNALIAEIPDLIVKNDVGGLERVKDALTANAVLLEEIHGEAYSLYIQAKESLECELATQYKKLRDAGENTMDARNDAKLETIPLFQEVNKQKIRKMKAKGLAEKVKDTIISLACRLKNMKSEITYGR